MNQNIWGINHQLCPCNTDPNVLMEDFNAALLDPRKGWSRAVYQLLWAQKPKT